MSPDFSIFFYIAHFLRFELSLNKFHLNNICNVIRKNNKKSRKSLIFGENGVLNFTFFVKLSHMATFVSWFSSFEAKSKARNYLTFTWNHIWSIENIEKLPFFSIFRLTILNLQRFVQFSRWNWQKIFREINFFAIYLVKTLVSRFFFSENEETLNWKRSISHKILIAFTKLISRIL